MKSYWCRVGPKSNTGVLTGRGVRPRGRMAGCDEAEIGAMCRQAKEQEGLLDGRYHGWKRQEGILPYRLQREPGLA